MDTKQLHNQIMRRVYYAYAISIATHSMLWKGAFLGAAAVLLAQWLHVASIIETILATPVGTVPSYVVNSFVYAATQGELVTVMVVLVALGVGFSSLLQVLRSLHAEKIFTRLIA